MNFKSIDFLIPKDLNDDHSHSGLETLRKCRLIVRFSMFIIPSLILVFMFNLNVEESAYFILTSTAGFMLLLLASLWIIKRNGNYKFAAYLITFAPQILSSMIIIIHGAFNVSMGSTAIITPIIAVVLLGIRSAVFVTVLNTVLFSLVSNQLHFGLSSYSIFIFTQLMAIAVAVSFELESKKFLEVIVKAEEKNTIDAVVTTFNHGINNPLAVLQARLEVIQYKQDYSKVEDALDDLTRVKAIIESVTALSMGPLKKQTYTKDSELKHYEVN